MVEVEIFFFISVDFPKTEYIKIYQMILKYSNLIYF